LEPDLDEAMRDRNLERPFFSLLIGVIPFLCLSLLMAGCGKKSFPKSMLDQPVLQVSNLQAQGRSKGIELQWNVPEGLRGKPKDRPFRFAVLRSDIDWENRNCMDCPAPEQTELLIVDPTFPEPAVLEGNTITWMDTTAAHHHAYRYQIVIQDDKGRPVSSSVQVTTKFVAPPAPIDDLATMTAPQGILVQWKPPTKDEKGRALQGTLQFNIERRSSNGKWERITAAPVRGNNYLDQSVAGEKSYDYRVTPVLLFEDTPIVGEAAITLQAKAPEAVAPPPPQTVWAIPSTGALEVQWTPSEGAAGGYHVYRREGKEIIRLTSNPVKNPPYVDKAIKKNTIYFYAISAIANGSDAREGLLSKWAEIRSLSFE
jgi:hypothetical protein